ncbi:hypothetical protein MZM54_03320 [[Brevibacterium] frigoritolerans]|nr:hypothetical protein [Peribacillus frigoritolerans]
MKDTAIRDLLLKQTEQIALNFRYDFVYEIEERSTLCQIVYRDDSGSILGTPLSFHLKVNEDIGKGEIIYYHSKGEFKRQKFDVYEENSLLNILVFIQERLSSNL